MDSISCKRRRNKFVKDSEKNFREVYPCSFVDENRKGFLSLEQGDATMAKYEKKFTKLAKHVMTFVGDEEDMSSVLKGH
ncbi:hypothetical protein Csa_018314 [Cucumis sativus]|uniref:Retrotransposon gag domain-containing protein n=1 Tax=Cucumis sativus TaxID=3659 RepID=A0A0A0KFT5_CUCSA|nr:hypothetical protein Csa_018314 [Cucumis sativus]